jgi:hypothetical protein
MPTTPPALTYSGVKYIAQGVRRFYWTVTVATLSSPTRAEMVAGVDLTGTPGAAGSLFDATGWASTQNFVPVPDFGTKIVGKIPGTADLADSSLVFYASSTSADVRAVLTDNLQGYIIILEEGDVPGQKMDAFKVQVGAVTVDQSLGNPAQVTVPFGIFATAKNITIPA